MTTDELKNMSRKDRAAYLARGRVSVEHTWIMPEGVKGPLLDAYFPKIRGYRLFRRTRIRGYATWDQARTAGQTALCRIRNEAREA